jgi:thiol-disulfide isomerase/thioredoxin
MEKFVDNVKYLEDFDFTGNILKPSKNSDEPYMIMIFASWCGHCKKTAPEYQKFADRVANEKLKAHVCCIQQDGERESEKKLGKKIDGVIDNFEGFPTIVLFRNGKFEKMYEDGRNSESFYKFLKNNM